MTEDWSEVERFVDAELEVFQAMLDTRAEERAGSKVVAEAERAWTDALADRRVALEKHARYLGEPPKDILLRFYEEKHVAEKGKVKRGD